MDIEEISKLFAKRFSRRRAGRGMVASVLLPATGLLLSSCGGGASAFVKACQESYTLPAVTGRCKCVEKALKDAGYSSSEIERLTTALKGDAKYGQFDNARDNDAFGEAHLACAPA